MLVEIRNRVKDLFDKTKLDIRKNKGRIAVLLAFFVATIMPIFYPVSVFGDGGDEPGSGYTMYWEEEGCPEEQVQVVVNVLWDDKNEDNRPEYILLQLYKNGESYKEPEVLSEDNGWSYYWGGLSAEAKWHIEEIEVPKDYTEEIVEAIENVYTIVHKYDPDGKLKKKDNTDVKDEPTSLEPTITTIPSFNRGPEVKETITMADISTTDKEGDINEDGKNGQKFISITGTLLAFVATVMMVIKSVAILKGIFKEEKDFT